MRHLYFVINIDSSKYWRIRLPRGILYYGIILPIQPSRYYI